MLNDVEVVIDVTVKTLRGSSDQMLNSDVSDNPPFYEYFIHQLAQFPIHTVFSQTFSQIPDYNPRLITAQVNIPTSVPHIKISKLIDKHL